MPHVLLVKLPLLIMLLCPFLTSKAADPFSGCLPREVAPDSIVSGEDSKSAKGDTLKAATVRQTLLAIKARCKRGKLVDGAGKEIYFYRLIGCWGNPPANYLELLERQHQKIQPLKKKYRVIQISCSQTRDPRRII